MTSPPESRRPREQEGTVIDGDEYLLAALRIAAGTDPVPARVGADARAVHALRLPGAVMALPVPVQGDGGHRGMAAPRRGAETSLTDHEDAGTRLLRFAAGEITFDLEVTVYAEHFDLAGQILPAPQAGTRVEIRTPYLSKVRFPAGSGDFATTGLPHGWLSVVCHRPELPPVATRWHRVR
ncbi:hypothetical protein GCM10009677_32570 [Sphaerisporangium rubeum]|uniref:Uncharacterized protein n=1 Tax=Sphaerisporangium rubeum TaxID=321317 RepID=A0A7X0M5N2_9ACTN|nr:hypothetical protein [Sphaerisporangium rubeum]MBB6472550.1 hypothetical protein [Sphaerisporangium rubeum]